MKKSKTLLAMAVTVALSANVSAAGNAPDFGANQDLLDVQNRCIVTLKNNVGDVKGLANAMAKRANASLKHVYQHSIKGFAINMPCHAASRAFGGDANIANMETDSIMFANPKPPGKGKPDDGGGSDPTQETPWGIGRVGTTDGTGRTAWVIDSGVDLDHPDLNVDISRAAFFVGKNADDQNGHGTHVAGTIGAINNTIGVVGVAANTTIVPVRVLDRRGSGSTSGVIAGVDHVAANASQGDCANMSLGGGVSPTLDQAVIDAASNGAYFVLAAGNDGDDANNHSPARANGTNVFTISAIDSSDNMPSWSNYGNPPVDFAAPGVAIQSTWKGGGYNTISGTSMAAPHACAVIMLKNGNPGSGGLVKTDNDNDLDTIIHL